MNDALKHQLFGLFFEVKGKVSLQTHVLT